MKTKYKLAIAMTAWVLIFSIPSISQILIIQNSIVGTWVPEGSNLDGRWVFKSDNTVEQYYEGNLYAIFNYSFTDQPICDPSQGPTGYTRFLNLTGSRSIEGNVLSDACYELTNDVDDDDGIIAISYVGGASLKPTVLIKQ